MSEALILAVRERRIENVRELLDSGMNVNYQDDAGHAAIHEAVLNLDLDMINLLASYHADLDIRDDRGFSVFNHVTDEYTGDEDGIFPTVDLLCQLSANPSNADLSGNTLLHDVAFNNYKRTTIRLIQAGADARLTTHISMEIDDEEYVAEPASPRNEAIDGGNQELADILGRVEAVQNLIEQTQVPRFDATIFRELSIESENLVDNATKLLAVFTRIHESEDVQQSPVAALLHDYLTPRDLTFFSSTARTETMHDFLLHRNSPHINTMS